VYILINLVKPEILSDLFGALLVKFCRSSSSATHWNPNWSFFLIILWTASVLD